MLTAVASYLDARAAHGTWLLRIDDLDPPRCVDGATEAIIEALTQHGLHWDGTVRYASARQSDYEQALTALAERGVLFYCNCSRKRLPRGPYPGHCRAHTEPRPDCAIRLRVEAEHITFHDRLAGEVAEEPASTCGDLIVRRRDGLIGYQLAVVVDDAADGVTDVVRGADLLDNTARQIYIARQLSLPEPRYLHLPTIDNRRGQKLSKQAHAAPIDGRNATLNLCWMIDLLGMALPRAAPRLRPEELLSFAIEQWRENSRGGAIERLPRTGFIGF